MRRSGRVRTSGVIAVIICVLKTIICCHSMTKLGQLIVLRDSVLLITLFRVGRNVRGDQRELTVKTEVSIGVLFDVRSLHLLPLFETHIMDRNSNSNLHLHPHISTVDITDSFAVSNAMCDLITKDVIAIVGVTNASSLSTIQSYSNTFHMPFISIGSTPSFSTNSAFQLFVRPSYMGAVVDLLHHFGCKKAVYIYDSDEGLMRIQDLFQSLNSRDLPMDLDVRRVNSLSVAKDIIGTLVAGDHVTKEDNKVFSIMDFDQLHILDIIRVLEKEHDIFKADLNIIAVSLDLLPLSSSNVDLSSANISGFQLVSTDHVLGLHGSLLSYPLKSTEALLMDAVETLRLAVEDVEQVKPGWLDLRSRLSIGSQVKCTNFVVEKTTHGLTLMDYLRQVEFEGHTGSITFDESGKRANFSLEIFQSIHGDPNKKIGRWYAEEGLHLSLTTHIEKTMLLLINNTRPLNIVEIS